ncbi:MAG TPA: NAD(P)/FAD-dependent oxidoreductase [Terriglobales bacterium]|nr:NAD(P)/FAD-dependent oxidoreductase [Terriglobales bacterium]
MTHVRTALIIGGGIAGPAAAMALQKAGIDAAVYEAHAGGAEGVGTFLTLGSNGIDALRVIGADERAVAAGFPTPGIVLRSTTGKRLGVARIDAALPDGITSHTLTRSDLYRALREEACARGIRFEHGRRLAHAVETADGVVATFADGTEAAGDLLVGCDGVHSTVRPIIDPRAPEPTYAGLVNVGGQAHGVDAESEPGSYTMIFGRRAFFGYAVAPDGDVWWFANLPSREEPARGDLAAVDAAEWRRRLVDLFRDDAGPAVRTLEATPDVAIGGASTFHVIPHLPVWQRGRMVVIGDAAHAPSPSSGQGASLSIEDAVVLAKCLRDVPDHGQALARFEALRRPRVERIIRAAARVNSSKAAGPVGQVVRDAMMPLFMRLLATGRQVQEVYGYRIDWDAPDQAA